MKKLSTPTLILVLTIVSLSCSNPKTELPSGTLTLNNWFVEEGNPNTSYDAQITIQFTGSGGQGTVSAWEGDGLTKSCVSDGKYSLNSAKNSLTIDGLHNSNCPWMSDVNGSYTYTYNDSRDGYNKFMFRKGNLLITHMFNKNR